MTRPRPLPVATQSTDRTRATLTLQDQIEAWVNEGGSGGKERP